MLKTILSKIVLAIILFSGIFLSNLTVSAQNKSELLMKGAEAIKNGKTEAGLNMIRQAALNNDNEASATLGGLFYAGLFVNKNIDSAIFWLEKSASLNHVGAMGLLGDIFLKDSPHKNIRKSIEWYEKAGKQNNVDALYNLGIIYSNEEVGGTVVDFVKAIAYFTKANTLGDVESFNSIGGLYATGGKNLKQDYQNAFSWYLKGAEKGNESCMYRVGVKYHKGEGVKADDEKALEWLKKASDAGNEGADSYLEEEFAGEY